MKKIVITLLATALLWSGATTAQQKPSIDLAVEPTDSTAHGCGVSESSLRSIATLTLRNNGISVDDNARQYVYIQSTVIDLKNDGCAVTLRVTFNSALTSKERAEALQGMTFKPRKPLSLTICNGGSLLTGPSHNMSQRVSADIEEKIKVCLGELIY